MALPFLVKLVPRIPGVLVAALLSVAPPATPINSTAAPPTSPSTKLAPTFMTVPAPLATLPPVMRAAPKGGTINVNTIPVPIVKQISNL